VTALQSLGLPFYNSLYNPVTVLWLFLSQVIRVLAASVKNLDAGRRRCRAWGRGVGTAERKNRWPAIALGRGLPRPPGHRAVRGYDADAAKCLRSVWNC
jgi:hypothetical protein